MAVVQIPNLPAAIALSGSEQLEAVQAGTSVRVTVAQIGQALGSPASPNLSLQFNNGGVFGGSSGITTDGVARITLGDQQTTQGSLVLANTAAGAWPVTVQSSNSATAAWTMTLPPAVAAGNGFILTSNTSGVTSWTNPTALGIDLDVGTTAITNGTVSRLLFQGAGDVLQQSANLTFASSTLTLGVAGSATGAAAFAGATSGTATITAQATAGSPTLTLPNASGTLVSTASVPLSINATTGAISITGAAGQVLAGATPAFTATPTFGVAGTTAGTLTLSGLTSGTVTLQTAAIAGTGTIFQFPSSNGASGTVLTTTGSGVTTWTSPSALGIDLDVGSTAITNGTAGRVLFQGAGDVLQQNANFFWDNTNNQLDLAAGTELLPALSTISDNNTGVFFPAADTVAVSTGGSERMRITSAGDVNIKGLGTAGVSQAVSFSGGAPTNSLVVATSGNVGIGFSNPSFKLDLVAPNLGATSGDAVSVSRFFSNTGNGDALEFVYSRSASSPTNWTTANLILRRNIDGTAGQQSFRFNGDGSTAFNYGSTDLMRITSAGNVGISTSLPGARLHVRGGNMWYSTSDFVINTTGTVLAISTGASTGNTYGLINSTNAGGSAWTDLVLQSGGGNVGIGNTSPSTYGKLSVFVSPATAGADGIYIPSSVTQLNSVVTGATYSFSGVGASQGWIYTTASDLNIGPYGAFNLKFIANNLERMRITSAGTVNIVGGGSPGTSQAVSFNGSAPINSLVMDSAGNTSFGGGTFTLNNSTKQFQLVTSTAFSPQVQIWNQTNDANAGYSLFIKSRAASGAAAAVQVGDAIGTFLFSAYDSNGVIRNSAYVEARVTAVAAGSVSSRMEFVTVGATSDIRFSPNGERMRITAAGTVNIVGAGSPGTSQAVSINGSAPIDSMVVNASGNVGIGISSPTVPLDVIGAVDTTFSPNVFNFRLRGTASATSGNSGSGISFMGYTTGTTTFTDIAFISGIKENTTNTNYAGALVFGCRTNGSGGGSFERMRIDSSGNVGIGTTNPNYRLQLNSNSVNTAQYVQFTNGSTGSASTDGMICGVSSTNDAIVWMQESAPLRFATSNAEAMRIDSSGNVLVGTITSPTTGTQCLTIETGTAPTATPADTVTFYSTDLSAGNTIPSIYTEGTGIVSANTGTTNLSNRIAVRINGTVYYLLAASSA